jgi:Bacterial TniB protein
MTHILNLDTRSHFNTAINDRLDYCLSEKYIHTPQNVKLWWLLEDLMRQVNPKSPKPKVMGCLVTGEPHSGKTTATRQFRKGYLANVKGAKRTDIVIFQIPSNPVLKDIMGKLGRELRIPDIPEKAEKRYPAYLLVEKIARKLIIDGTKLLIIDEFQNLSEISGKSRIAILSSFNDLLNESHVPIILVGVSGVDEILELEHYADRSNLNGTFCSRFPEFQVQPWKDPDNEIYGGLLRTIYEDCNLSLPPGTQPFYTDDDLREKILEITGGLTGKIIHVIKWTARHLIRNHLPETITSDVIDAVFEEIRTRGWMHV